MQAFELVDVSLALCFQPPQERAGIECSRLRIQNARIDWLSRRSNLAAMNAARLEKMIDNTPATFTQPGLDRGALE